MDENSCNSPLSKMSLTTVPPASSKRTPASNNPSQTTTNLVAQSPGKEAMKLLSSVRMEHLLAGVSGGVASTLILHPLDLIKTRFAVNDGLQSRPQYNGLYDAFKSIVRDEGARGLYR